MTGLSAVMLSGPIGYTPLYMLLALSLISLLYTLIGSRSLRFRECESGDIFVRKSNARIKVELRNRGILLIPHVSLCYRYGENRSTADFSLHARKSLSVDIILQFDHVGEYQAGMKSLTVYGLLGVLRLRRGFKPHTVRVAPRLIEADTIVLKADGAASAVRPSEQMQADPSDEHTYNGVRGYMPGDSLKNINWPLTAHTAEYMSRLYENQSKSRLSVVLDLTPSAGSAAFSRELYDCLSEAALACVLLGVRRGLSTRLIFSRGDKAETVPVGSRDELQRLAPMFAALPTGGGCPAEELIGTEPPQRDGWDNLIVCTAALTDGLAGALAALAARHGCVTLICAVPPGWEPEPERDRITYLGDRHVDCRFITSADELAAENALQQAAAAGNA